MNHHCPCRRILPLSFTLIRPSEHLALPTFGPSLGSLTLAATGPYFGNALSLEHVKHWPKNCSVLEGML